MSSCVQQTEMARRQGAPGAKLPLVLTLSRSLDVSTRTLHAAYSTQWNNPLSEIPIASIDFRYGNKQRRIPALLALTAATAQ